MSHTARMLKEIASSEEYRGLLAAIEEIDFESMFASYMRVRDRIKKGRATIEESIESLPTQNKEERRGKFSHAFELATERILPVWHQLDRQLDFGCTRRNIMGGEVFGFGKKGDPLVKTPSGATVVLSGSKAQEGERVWFRVLQETEKISFGRVFQIDVRSFYLLLTHQAREQITDCLAFVRQQSEVFPESTDEGRSFDLAELLRKLGEAKELSSGLRDEDRERITVQVMNYRKRLLAAAGERMMFDFISRQEEEDIESFYQDGQQERVKALAAMGLFRRGTYEAARQKFRAGDGPDGYAEALGEMRARVDSMDAAVELLDFQSALDDVYPRAKRYLQMMDRLFNRLAGRGSQVADALSRRDVIDPEEVSAALRTAVSEEGLLSELRKAFRSSKEFMSLRGAFLELHRRLGNHEAVAAETAFRPYLRHKVLQAFGSDGSMERR